MIIKKSLNGGSQWLLLMAMPAALHAISEPVEGLIYTYENTTSGAVDDVATPCVSPLVRSFSVSDSFTVSGIAVGLNIDHTYRGDLVVTLIAPDATSLQLFAQNGGDGDDNHDIWMSTNTEGALDDGDVDPTAEPFYSRLVSIAGLGGFYTGNASGTWSLQVCDFFAVDSGTFNRARLVLSSSTAATTVGTSSVTYDWGANGNNAAFVGATISGVTLSQTSTTDFGGAGTNVPASSFFNLRTTTTSLSGESGYYSLYMDALNIVGAGTESETVGEQTTFGFSPEVRDLTFALKDIDFLSTDFEDLMCVLGLDAAGNSVPFTIALGTAHQLAGNTIEGDTATPNTQTEASATVVFDGPVASVRIDHMQSDDAAVGPGDQLVGISDFTFTAFDFGDAPSTFSTQLGGGARHVLSDRSLFLGANPPDGESDGQPGSAATSDDTTAVGGVDDEDGVASFPNYDGTSSTYTVSVTATNLSTTTAANLVGYIDWNRDGDFADADERSATVSIPANTASATAFNVTWSSVPANAGGTTATYARFRIATLASEVESPSGLAANGEVEDYPIIIDTLPVALSYFLAERQGSELIVNWATETETSTVGYAILGRGKSGWQRLQAKLIPARALDSLKPQHYRIELDAGGLETGSDLATVLLEDWDVEGRAIQWGPFEIGTAYGRQNTLRPIGWTKIRHDAESAVVSSRAAAKAVPRLDNGAVLAELRVDREGLQRVLFEDLLNAGVDLEGVSIDRLRLRQARDQQPIPITVAGSAGRPESMGPGGWIEFRGLPRGDNLYTRQRVYQLVLGKPRRVRLHDSRPRRGALESYQASVQIERDLVYSLGSPNGDPWFEAAVLAQASPAERRFTLNIDQLASTSGRLQVGLWGVTNWPGAAPDHSIEIYFNGTLLAAERFDGLTQRDFDLEVPTGVLLAGANELTVRLPGDTGYAFDLVHIDRYELSFARHFVARDGRLSFTAERGSITVEGLSTPEVVVYSSSGRVRLTGVVVEPSGSGWRARFSLPRLRPGVDSEQTWVDVVETRTLATPEVRAPRATAEDLLTGPADYVMISHPAFTNDLGALIAARLAEGLTVKVVDIFDLYQTYSGGEIDPEAIRSYLRHAARRLSTRYVLLVGGDTYDYLDHLRLGSVSFVPTLYAQTDSIVRFSPADSLLADIDGDGLQDLAIGRLPARSQSELRLLIDKTLRYPSTPAAAVLAADSSDDRHFSTLSEELASFVPNGWPVTSAYIDRDGVEQAHDILLEAIAQGAALVNFVGHSGPSVWSFQGLFSTTDSAALSNTRAPTAVIQWGCWNTYHVAPEYDTLAHSLLLSGSQGAAAVVGSATLSQEISDRLLGPALLSRALQTGTRLGDAILEAKREVASGGGDLRDVIVGWTLLGDPALVINP